MVQYLIKMGIISIFKNNSKQKNISVKTEDSPKNSSYKEVCKVQSYNIYKLIDEYLPDVLKIDIEGSEFICFKDKNEKINECVKEIFIEIHVTKNNNIDSLQHILDQFEEVQIKENIAFNRVYAYDVYLKRK